MEELVRSVNNLTVIVESRLPMQSKRGSDLSKADLHERFLFAGVRMSDFDWKRKGIARVDALFCYSIVRRFALRIAKQYRRGNVLEVPFVQPETFLLFHQLTSVLLEDAEVRREVYYKSHDVHVHGKMDSGLFMPRTNLCVLPNEDKRMDVPLTEGDICQAGSELAASIEILRSCAVNPLMFNSLLNSGREWKVLRRVLYRSQPLWQYTDSLYLFDRGGQVDEAAVFLLTRILLHCFSVSKELIALSKIPVDVGYGDGIDDGASDVEEEEEEEEEKANMDGDKKENCARTSKGTEGGKALPQGKKGSTRKSSSRRFGTVLSSENLRIFDVESASLF